eukprot:gene3680-4197_t
MSTSASYWNWTEAGDYFNEAVPVLYNLKIPQFLKNVSVCDHTCQQQHFLYLSNFYYQTNGHGWLKKRDWPDRSIFYCHWEGVLCYNRTNHVIAINLEGNNGMRGSIGASLGGLPYLLGVNLGGSELYDDVSDLLNTFKPFFIRYDVAFNKISGLFPPTIARDKPFLGKIQLSGNPHIQGSLPEDIHLLKDLQVLSIGETGIGGKLPSSIGRLSNLLFLDLEILRMEGNLRVLKGLSKLGYMHLLSNEIQGEIPEDFGDWFPSLLELNLQGNKIHGPIPASIGRLTRLKLLSFSGNKKLTGNIPASFSNLTSLEMLNIASTSVRGFERGLVLGSKTLSSFNMAGSETFSCSIYDLVHALHSSKNSLIQLNVENCDIYGRFDKFNDDSNMVSGIFSFARLTYLGLGNNTRLTGTIPDPITSLGLLMYLNVSKTMLNGSLPVVYLTKLAALQQIDIRGTKMSGDVLNRYMTVDYSVMKKEALTDNFRCPEIRLKYNGALVMMNSFYYDRRYCKCDLTNYGLGGYCEKCLLGGDCSESSRPYNLLNTTFPNPLFFYVTFMRLRKGYWPSPNANDVQEILKCPWTLPGHEICNPHGDVLCAGSRFSDRWTTKCDNASRQCVDGAYGRLCSKCKQGYYKDSTRCELCHQSSHATIAIIASVFIIAGLIASVALFAGNIKMPAIVWTIVQAVVIFVLAAVGILPSWLAQLNILLLILAIGGFGQFSKGFVKIAVFYVQVADALISTSHVWPNAVYQAQKLISSAISLRFSGLSCKWPRLFTPTGEFALIMLLPIFVAVAVWLGYAVWYCVKGRTSDSNIVKHKCGHLCIVFLNLAYFSLVKASTSALAPCAIAGGRPFMTKYAWIECNSNSEYKTLRNIAYAAIPLYVLGTPVLFLGLLYWNKERIKEEETREKIKSWLGSLFTVYQPDYHVYMEVLLMFRRLAVAMLLSFFSEGIIWQTVSVCFVLIVYLAFESHAKPFAPVDAKSRNPFTRYGLENVTEISMLIVLIVSFVVIQCSRVYEQHIYVLVWVIIVVNLLLIALLMFGFIKRMTEKNHLTQSGGGAPNNGEIQQPSPIPSDSSSSHAPSEHDPLPRDNEVSASDPPSSESRSSSCDVAYIMPSDNTALIHE